MTQQAQHTPTKAERIKAAKDIILSEPAMYGQGFCELARSHSDLLKALERMLAAHDADVEMGSIIAAGNGCAAEQARSAIANTRGL